MKNNLHIELVNTHYEYNENTKVMNAITTLACSYLIMQVVNVQWIQEMKNGECVVILYLDGEDNLGSYSYRLVLLGRKYEHQVLQPKQLLLPSNKADQGVMVVDTIDIVEPENKHKVIFYPVKHKDYTSAGLLAYIVHPYILSRLNNTAKGKVNHA